MTKKAIQDRIILKGYTAVHPALDFYNNKTILAVGRPGLTVFDDGSQCFEQYSFCITSDGDSFILTTKEMLDRKVYYLKELDLPIDRWELDDQEQFVKALQNGHKPKIDLQQIYADIKGLFVELFDFKEEKLYDFFPTFIIYTYFFPLFESAPVVHLWGPAGSGKTKIIEMLSMMAFNPVTSGNITEASVFRLVEGRRAVCLLDESEDLSKTERGKAIINLILNGYRRGTKIYRSDKMRRTIMSSHYDVYSPKVIANIVGLDKEAMISRSIRIMTNSSYNTEKANRYTAAAKDRADIIRNQLYRACLSTCTNVTLAKDTTPSIGLTGRSAEIWQGILTIAWLIGGETWHNLSWLAIESSQATERELIVSNPAWDLLSALLNMVTITKPQFYSNEAVWKCITTYAGGEFNSKQQITELLRRQDIPARIRYVNGKTTRGFVLSKSQIENKLSFITPLRLLRPNSQKV